MTPERRAALEAVAEAARWMQRLIQPDIDTTPRNCREPAYLAAVALSNALDALPPAQPAVETVEVAGAVMQNGHEYYVVNESEHGRYHGGIVARFTVSVPVHPIPTILATVEPTP